MEHRLFNVAYVHTRGEKWVRKRVKMLWHCRLHYAVDLSTTSIKQFIYKLKHKMNLNIGAKHKIHINTNWFIVDKWINYDCLIPWENVCARIVVVCEDCCACRTESRTCTRHVKSTPRKKSMKLDKETKETCWTAAKAIATATATHTLSMSLPFSHRKFFVRCCTCPV